MGLNRLGVCTSNSIEKTNSVLEIKIEMTICDIISKHIGKMSQDPFHRYQKAASMIKNDENRTPYDFAAH